MKINWKQKLASRKFWCAIAGVILSVLTASGAAPALRDSIEGVILAVGVLAAYIFSEALVDAARESKRE